MEGLEDRLRAHSARFSAMVALIPPQYYVVKEEKVEEVEGKQRAGKTKGETRFWHNKKEQLQNSRKMGKNAPSSRESTERVQGDGEEGDKDAAGDSEKPWSVERVRSSSLSDLQSRLRKKIEEASLKRRLTAEEGGEAEKRKRRRGNDRGGEPERKLRRVEDKQKRRKSARKEREAKQKRAAVKVAGTEREVSDTAKPSVNSSTLSFSRFEFGQTSKTGGKRKNYKALIVKAEAKQKRLEELKEQDEERGEVAQERERWTKAVKMAGGEKVKDDPKLLKRTVKRLQKKKQAHKRKWGERVREEAQRKGARQQKRQENIRERTDKIKAKNARKRAKKKGKV